MKADIDTTVDVLLDLLSLIWEEEIIPDDWCKGLRRLYYVWETGEESPDAYSCKSDGESNYQKNI